MIDLKPLAGALVKTLVASDEHDNGNVADAMFEIARAVSSGFKWLGNGDASTHFGALEGVGMAILESSQKVSAGLEGIGDALGRVADALENCAPKATP